MLGLRNFIRENRRRLALSQNDVAVLLGFRSGTKASRLACFVRNPGFEEALVLAAIFRKPVEEIFAGTFRQIFFSSRRRHTRSVSAFLLNRSSDLRAAQG